MDSVSLTALVEAFDEPVLILRSERTIAANTAARSLLGERIVHRDIRLAMRHPQALDAALKGARRDIDIVGLAGSDRPWRIAVRPLDHGGTLIRMIDRSETIAAERMRVDFVANASHELRTPLATVTGYAETLAEQGSLPDESRIKFAETILLEARRMLRIIEDLMSLSRIEADRFVVPTEPVDLAELAEQAIEQISPLAERRNVAVELNAKGGRPALVRGDAGQLLQAIDNLLSNAIRYGAEKEGDRVEVRLARRDGFFALDVVDSGPGVDPVHLPRLTERFYRVDDARSRKSGGTGLGLAIVKHIVERHRGRLEITSGNGSGTRASLLFPAMQEDRVS